MTKTTSNSVATTTSVVQDMIDASKVCRDFYNGGKHIRNLGTEYLPKFPPEDDDQYEARKASSWVFNGIRKTIEDIAAKIFDSPVYIETEDKTLKAWSNNMDMQGNDASLYLNAAFENAQRDGIAFTLVDAPIRPAGLSKAAADKGNYRPYAVALELEDVLGWKVSTVANVATVTQLRFWTSREEVDPKDEFKTETIRQVKVMDIDFNDKTLFGTVKIRLYEKTKGSPDNAEWVQYGDTQNTGLTQIYFRALNLHRKAFLSALPPYADLAELNWSHYQSQSDQRNSMHYARAPLLFFKGFAPEFDESGAKLPISASYGYTAEAEHADMKFVEHTGAALGAGRTELKDLEFQMQAFGFLMVVSKTGNHTATGEKLDDKKANSRIGMWADILQEFATSIFNDFKAIGKNGGEFVTHVNKDFADSVLSHLDMDVIDRMYERRVISGELYVNECKRRNILEEDVEANDEQAKLIIEHKKLQNAGVVAAEKLAPNERPSEIQE